MLAEVAGLPSAPALAQAAANANRINHIFGKAMHKMDLLIKACGSKGKALQDIQTAAKALANPNLSLMQEFSAVVNGVPLTIPGQMAGGVFGVATAFIS